ncbi:DUF4925 domain-containing protein [uncultured Alistipes sp.]|uniref:DUF4925 domain-containing protein n=1 Tax=uncultured Alistipes sp. TaxID=538949 RepID=UPI0025E20859|nr:DUF4925 domain-containing protein [uncultured Alistipes sp.]
MKRNLATLALAALLCLAAACSKDDTPRWQLPTEELTGETLVVTLNGDRLERGSAQLALSAGSTATLALRGVVNGYASIEVPVALSRLADGGTGFAGSRALPAPALTRTDASAEGPATFDLEVEGRLAADGEEAPAQIGLTLRLTTEGSGGLTGEWPLSRTIYASADRTDAIADRAPLRLVWSAADPAAPNAGQLAKLGSVLGSRLLGEVLASVTLEADGNLTASYHPGLVTDRMRHPETGEWVSTREFMEQSGGTELFGDELSYWIFQALFSTTPTVDPYPRRWIASPRGLMTWYVADGRIYLLPDTERIVRQATGDDALAGSILALLRNLREMDDEALRATIGELGESLGTDLSGIEPALLREVLGWLDTGIPMRYEQQADGLKLYVDRTMAEPFMRAVLGFMPQLDRLFGELAAQKPMMGMIFYLLGFENFTALQGIWTDNTADFELALHFGGPAAEASRLAAPLPRPTDAGDLRRLLRLRLAALAAVR